MNSKVGFWLRRAAIEFESASIAKLFKFSCFGSPFADSNSRRLLAKFPTFEFFCVYRRFNLGEKSLIFRL
jgi:hypothetical protein